MDMMSLGNVLEYLYDRFILTFILCLIGAIIRETMNTMKLTSINIKRMMASVIMASTLMCIVVDYVEFQFSIYIAVCIIVGIWSPYIMKVILDSKIMGKFVRGVLKNMKDPIAKGISEAITDLDETDTKEEEPKNTSDENTEKKTDDS